MGVVGDSERLGAYAPLPIVATETDWLALIDMATENDARSAEFARRHCLEGDATATILAAIGAGRRPLGQPGIH